MKQAALEQLLHCRRMRQDQAGAVLAARRLARHHADQQIERAQAASAQHDSARRQREADLLDGLQGRKLSLVELGRYQRRLANLAAEADRLRAQLGAAETEARRCDGLIAEAQAAFRDHRREHEKWRELTLVSAAAAERRIETLAEIEAESLQSDRDGARLASGRTF